MWADMWKASLDVTEKWLVDGAIRLENYSDFGFVNTYKFATRYKVSDEFNLRGSVSTGYPCTFSPADQFQ